VIVSLLIGPSGLLGIGAPRPRRLPRPASVAPERQDLIQANLQVALALAPTENPGHAHQNRVEQNLGQQVGWDVSAKRPPTLTVPYSTKAAWTRSARINALVPVSGRRRINQATTTLR
jgi:hypothetical protein